MAGSEYVLRQILAETIETPDAQPRKGSERGARDAGTLQPHSTPLHPDSICRSPDARWRPSDAHWLYQEMASAAGTAAEAPSPVDRSMLQHGWGTRCAHCRAA